MGAPKQTECSRGHKYADHGYVNAHGYHICRACILIRQGNRYRRAKHGARMARLLRQGLMIESKDPGVRMWQRWVFEFFEEAA